jgi:uncharacterized membrane protein YgdD (TMEM256/DUF423 family)
MNGKFWIVIGALSMGISIGLSAYGAHGVPAYLESKPEFTDVEKRVERWKTASQFHTLHSLGLILVGILSALNPPVATAPPASKVAGWGLCLAGWLMLTGVLLFCGLLYIAAIRLNDFGGLVPSGGMCLIGAWLVLAISVASCRR